jgi:hypothetical protein
MAPDMGHVPASLDELRMLFDRVELVVDPLVVDRIFELHASFEEITEAMNVDGKAPATDPPPSSPRVAEVRAILAELLEDREPDALLAPEQLDATDVTEITEEITEVVTSDLKEKTDVVQEDPRWARFLATLTGGAAHRHGDGRR